MLGIWLWKIHCDIEQIFYAFNHLKHSACQTNFKSLRCSTIDTIFDHSQYKNGLDARKLMGKVNGRFYNCYFVDLRKHYIENVIYMFEMQEVDEIVEAFKMKFIVP